jgi:hypothetical protein
MNGHVAPDCVVPDASSGVTRSAMKMLMKATDAGTTTHSHASPSTSLRVLGADEASAPTQEMRRRNE